MSLENENVLDGPEKKKGHYLFPVRKYGLRVVFLTLANIISISFLYKTNTYSYRFGEMLGVFGIVLPLLIAVFSSLLALLTYRRFSFTKHFVRLFLSVTFYLYVAVFGGVILIFVAALFVSLNRS